MSELRKSTGRSFQIVGPETGKLRQPKRDSTRGTTRSPWSADLGRDRAATVCTGMYTSLKIYRETNPRTNRRIGACKTFRINKQTWVTCDNCLYDSAQLNANTNNELFHYIYNHFSCLSMYITEYNHSTEHRIILVSSSKRSLWLWRRKRKSCVTGGGLAQLVATLVGSTKLLYAGPG